MGFKSKPLIGSMPEKDVAIRSLITCGVSFERLCFGIVHLVLTCSPPYPEFRVTSLGVKHRPIRADISHYCGAITLQKENVILMLSYEMSI